MARSDPERITALEQALVDLHEDRDDRKHEEERTRDRLHKLEGAVGLLLEAHKSARRAEEKQYRRLEILLHRLTVAIAFAALALSVVVVVVGKV